MVRYTRSWGSQWSCHAQAAAKKAPQLSKEEVQKLRQANDPNFHAKKEKPGKDKGGKKEKGGKKGGAEGGKGGAGEHLRLLVVLHLTLWGCSSLCAPCRHAAQHMHMHGHQQAA